MKTTKHTVALLSTAIATVLLASCGGGGGSGTASGGSGGGTGSTSTIVTSVPAAAYAAGSQEKAAYDYLNAERAKCGFGLLAQNAKLDQAAAAHANYLVVNDALGHSEVAGQLGFTGSTVTDRVVATGYNQGAGSWSASENYAQNTNSGLEATRYLLVAPYHLVNLIDGYWDVGMGYKTASKSQNVINVFAYMFGVAPNMGIKQLPVNGTVLTYPCQGVTNIRPSFENELQNWTGGPIGAGSGGAATVVVAPNGEALIISSATYNIAGGGNATPVSVLTASNDPNRVVKTSNAFIIPPASLAANTTYRVQIAGTAAGVAFTKDFTFTTGS